MIAARSISAIRMPGAIVTTFAGRSASLGSIPIVGSETPVAGSRAAVRQFRKQGGGVFITNVSSIAARTGGGGGP